MSSVFIQVQLGHKTNEEGSYPLNLLVNAMDIDLLLSTPSQKFSDDLLEIQKAANSILLKNYTVR